MVANTLFYAASVLASLSQVSAHAAMWDVSMFGLNQSSVDNPVGNRPQDPLINLAFKDWWFHGHLDFPPHPEDVKQLPVGGDTQLQISCDIDATELWPFGPGGDQRDPSDPDNPCPRSPMSAYHTNGINDLGGCALAVAYKSNARDVHPEDFVVFSVNHTCVWRLNTTFSIPQDMPKCDDGKCTCAFFWMHLPDSGSEQMYMNGFQCNFAGATSNKKLGIPKPPRRCGAEQANNFVGDPSNCTYGAKQPIYWLQKERNNVFEGYYETPLYTELYHYLDGAQNDIFENSTDAGSSSILPHSAPTANPTQMSSSSPSQGTQTSSPGTSDPTTPSASASGGDSYSYSGAAMPKASQPSSYSPPQGTPASSTGSSDPEAQYSSYPPMSYGTTYTESWAAEQTTGGPKPDKCPNKKSRRNDPRDAVHADQQAIHRAWGAHRRRSVGNHVPL